LQKTILPDKVSDMPLSVLKANKKVLYLFKFLAEEALNKLNYHKLNKKTLRISWYNREQNNLRDHPEYNVFVKKIQKSVTPQEFHEFFTKFGNVVSARLVEDDEGDNVGYGFVLYDSEQSANLAIREANNAEWKGKNIFVGTFIKNRPKKKAVFNNLYVKNIPQVIYLLILGIFRRNDCESF
jgi:polyadenylate-binding protein